MASKNKDSIRANTIQIPRYTIAYMKKTYCQMYHIYGREQHTYTEIKQLQ